MSTFLTASNFWRPSLQQLILHGDSRLAIMDSRMAHTHTYISAKIWQSRPGILRAWIGGEALKMTDMRIH